MKVAGINIIMLLSFSTSLFGQNASSQLYLGQQPPGEKAELYANGIVSTPLYEHSSPVFSPDGKLVLWGVFAGNNYLLQSSYENGAWTKAARPSFTDSLHGYVYPSFSADGKILYFSSNRPGPAGYSSNGNRIWQVRRMEAGWGEPVPFDTIASQGGDYANAITKKGTLYFSSAVRRGTNWNIRRAEIKDGRYTKPVLLPYPINSIDYEDGAYVDPDERYLIFESQRPEGTNGNLSLFISFKNNNGQWSLPVNMGPTINSGNGERFAKLSPDGKYLFFGSFRDPQPNSRGADIYWVDANVIEELRQIKEANIFIEQPLGDSILAALDRRDVRASTGFLKQWLDLHPGHLDAMVIYSSMLRRQNRSVDAANIFTPFKEEWKTNNALLMELALIKAGTGDEVGARQILAPVLAQPMDLRKKYMHLADELLAMQLYQLSDEYFEHAHLMRPQAVGLYNRACGYALVGEKNKAFALLSRAAEGGFHLRKDYEMDPDLQSLKEDPRWNVLMEKLK